VATAADHKGFAVRAGHEICPRGPVGPGFARSVSLADVVDFHLVDMPACLASPGEESGDQFLALGIDRGQLTVGDDRLLFCRSGIPPNRPTSGFLPVRSTRASKHLRGRAASSVVAEYLRAIFDTDERCLFARRHQHRGLHDPLQPGESEDVAGHQVVLDDAAVLGPVGAEDDVIVLIQQFGPTRGFAAASCTGLAWQIPPSEGRQTDGPIDRAPSAGDLAVVVKHGDVVARNLAASVRA